MKILLLSVCGFLFILLDLVLLPGVVLLLFGSCLILYAIYLNYLDYGLLPALLHLAVSLAFVPKMITWSLGRVALKNEMKKEDGYVGIPDRKHLIGMKGKALSDLRPAGAVALQEGDEEIRLDCVAQGGYIEQGARVVIVEDRGPSLVVRQLEEPSSAVS